MTQSKLILVSYKKLQTPRRIVIANGSAMEAVGVGDVVCSAHDGKSWYETIVRDVHHVPQLGTSNLFSQRTAAKKGYVFTHDDKTLSITEKETQKVVLMGDSRRTDGLFVLRLKTVHATANVASAPNLQVWHHRLGHTGKQKILHMERNDSAAGLEIGDKATDFDCTDCSAGRMIRTPCPESKGKKCIPGERLFADLADGKCPSLGGALYFMIIKDEATAYRSVFFLKTKDEAAKLIMHYVAKVEKQTGNAVKCFRTDNGGEFVNAHLKDFLASRGIEFELTQPYTPQENGSVERDNRTVKELENTMLHAAKLNRALWAEMVHTAVYLHNRVPNRKEDKSPLELWFGHRPFIGHLRIIGSTCSVHIPKPQRSGWGKASWTGILVGYGQSNKFYRVYNPESREVITRKDVKVTEPEIKAQASLPEDADDKSEEEEAEKPKVEKKGRGRPK